ncbi:MAG: sulfotransferase [Planctomycetota bacterium]
MSLSPERTSELLLQARDAAARGDYAQAHAIGTTLLQNLPKDPQVNLLMGEVCLATGFLDMAIEYRRFAVENLPPAPLLEVQLAQAYVHSGRLGDALAHYANALKLDANFAPAIAGRAEVYEMQGNFKRAWKTLEPATKVAPTDPSLAAVGVRVLMEMRRLDDAIRLGEVVMAAKLPDEPQLRSTLLTMARAYERAKRYQDALEVAARGNAMLAVPFSQELYRAETDTLIETFSKDWMKDAPRATVDGSWATFIVGMPRSGSTLTERIIHAHPDAFGADEDFSLQLIAGSVQAEFGLASQWPEHARELTSEQLDRSGEKYERSMRTKSSDAKLISNKDLANMRRLGFADRILPGAKFIHTRRNAADNCLSCYFERLRPASIPYAGSFDDLAFVSAENERLWAHWQDACQNDTLTVDYEDLVNDLPGTARRIIDFVGLPWDDRCLKPHEANRADRTLSVTQVRRPIYTAAKGRAAKYGDLLEPLQSALKRHGVDSKGTEAKG